MIAGIVIGNLVLLGILVLWQRVWTKVIWGSAGKSVDVSCLVIHFRMPRRPRRKKKKAKKKRREGLKTDFLGWIKLAPGLLQSMGRGSKFLLRHSDLRHLRLEGGVGLEDMAATGMIWGTVHAAYWILQPWSSNFELAVTPTFGVGSTNLTFNAVGTVRLVILFATTAIILWYLPKWKLLRLLQDQGHGQ